MKVKSSVLARPNMELIKFYIRGILPIADLTTRVIIIRNASSLFIHTCSWHHHVNNHFWSNIPSSFSCPRKLHEIYWHERMQVRGSIFLLCDFKQSTNSYNCTSQEHLYTNDNYISDRISWSVNTKFHDFHQSRFTTLPSPISYQK